MELKGCARAKINLHLDVLGRRADGYHDIRTVMQQIDLADTVRITLSKGRGIRLKTNLAYLPTGEENTAWRAAKALSDLCGIDRAMDIDIHKRIPVSAGLAGGSTDAAMVLKLLNRGLGLGLSEDELLRQAAAIGADVPFCLLDGAALAEGIGERLTPVESLERGFILLSKPNLAVSTARVYQNLDLKSGDAHPDPAPLLEAMAEGDLAGVAGGLFNRLEPVTLSMHPVVGDVKRRMLQYGALGSLMSGSGPTVFGLFRDYAKIKAAYKNLKKTYQQTYIVTTYSKEERA